MRWLLLRDGDAVAANRRSRRHGQRTTLAAVGGSGGRRDAVGVDRGRASRLGGRCGRHVESREVGVEVDVGVEGWVACSVQRYMSSGMGKRRTGTKTCFDGRRIGRAESVRPSRLHSRDETERIVNTTSVR